MASKKSEQTIKSQINGIKFACGSNLLDVPIGTIIYDIRDDGAIISSKYCGFAYIEMERTGPMFCLLDCYNRPLPNSPISSRYVMLQKAKNIAIANFKKSLEKLT